MVNKEARGLDDRPLIKPMEPILIKEMPKKSDCLAQVKWDGIRLLAYVRKGKVRLYTRNHRSRTLTYPEIVMDLRAQFPSQELILDGECVSFKDGKANFFQVLKRDRMKDLDKIKEMMKGFPAVYMVFDLLYLNGEWLTSYPLVDRLDQLSSLLISTPFVQLCSTIEDGGRLWKYIKTREWEGMVLKKKRSVYHAGKKHRDWKKVKVTQKIEAFVIGVTFRSRKVNSLIVGIHDDDAWQYIGKVSSGLSQKEIELITNWVASVRIDEPPQVDVPLEKQKIVWVPPHLKVKISFFEWTPSGTLRSPVIQGYSFQK